MMDIFLNVMNAISESRFWLMPLLLGIVLVLVAVTFVEALRNMQEEMDEGA